MFPTRLLRTSSFRLTLLYAGLFSVSALILFGVTYWPAAEYAANDESAEIGVEFRSIEDEAKLAGYDRLPEIIADRLRERRDVHAVYLLADAAGNKLAGNAPPRPPILGAMKFKFEVGDENRTIRAQGFRLANGDYLLVGQDTASLHEMKELIARAFGTSAAATLLLAILGGLLMSRSVLRRIEGVSRTSRAIVEGDLSNRVPLRNTDDEFDHLAVSVNTMLDRIEDLMSRMRQVSSDIAHDLRTPLTRLRQRLEHARRRSYSTAELHDLLDCSVADVDAILDTFGALLRIAQIEAGGQASEATQVDLSKLARSLADDFAPAAEDRDQTIAAETSTGIMVKGDRDLLTQMIVNLLDNAVRHSPPKARILVGVARRGDAVELVVADSGPGIPETEREKVLRPFYRLESSRTTEGSGLGLSLVAAIAKRHNATIALTDNGPGLRVIVTLPLGAAAAASDTAPSSNPAEAKLAAVIPGDAFGWHGDQPRRG